MAHLALEDLTSGGASDAEECRAARSTRRMSAVATVLAVLSAALVLTTQHCAALRRSEAGSVGAVGLSAEGPWSEPGSPLGWQRAYLPSLVRQGPSADSPVVQELPAGSLVYAAAAEGGRMQVTRPAAGWMSMKTADGVGIMFPEMALRGLSEADDPEGALRSDPREAANAMVRARVAEVTQVQQRLAESMRRLKEKTESLQRHPTAAVKEKAKALAHVAGGAAKRVAASPDVQRLVKDLAHQPLLQGLFH
mmetsp:Transcript_96793/g.269408  ORF Transcript_96793/g.269408 Transcript_96793/m.269408 type:complete len:251 (+) Transcript_96793:84-836(+)